MIIVTVPGGGLSRMCRICLTGDVKLINIYAFSTKLKTHIVDVLTKCVPVNIKRNDNLPTFVCKLCYVQLEKLYKFRTKAVQSESTLRRYLKVLQSVDLVQRESDPSYRHSKSRNTPNSSRYNNTNHKRKTLENTNNDVNVIPSNIQNSQIYLKQEIANEDFEQDGFDDTFNSDYDDIKSEIEKVEVKVNVSEIIEPYLCNVCTMRFESEDQLSNHKRTHSSTKPIQAKSARTKTEKSCTGEKLHQCDVCNKIFKLSGNLKIHKRVHTGERPFQCDVCGKCFSIACTLETHKLLHTGEKPYGCDVCGNAFVRVADLKSHKRVHTGERPYQCEVCTKTFTQLCNLKTHQRLHTGERPYECDICKKRFYHPSSFKIHKRIHTGEKPYQCDVCSRSFVRLCKLRQHKQRHINSNPC